MKFYKAVSIIFVTFFLTGCGSEDSADFDCSTNCQETISDIFGNNGQPEYDRSEYESMSPKFIDLGSKLKFQLYEKSQSERYNGAITTSSPKSSSLFNFVFTEHRSWDNRNRLYGVRNGHGVYLLSVEGVFEEENKDVDYGNLIEAGCIELPPLYFDMTNDNRTFTHKVRDDCSIDDYAGMKTVVVQSYLSGTKKISLTISKGSTSYSSSLRMDETGVYRLDEGAKYVAERVSSVNLLATLKEKPDFISIAEAIK